MTLRMIKERFKRLQHGPFHCLVSLIGTIQQSVKFRSPISIWKDKEGDWHNRRQDLTLVSPELSVASWDEVRNAVSDYWAFDYSPLSGDTVVDVGAGIGDDAVAFARLVGRGGRVIAIEAHPHTYRCLTKTIAANGLDNVTCVNAAVSDKDGMMAISTEANYLSNSMHAGKATVQVPSRPLGRILSDLGAARISLIKMNIEGAETNALKGMREVLARTPHVVVSCHDFKSERGESDEFRTFRPVCDLLSELGFTLRTRDGDPRPEVRYFVYGTRDR